MLVGVIEKYGVVPQSAYPDKWSSTASRRFNAIMTALLRDWAMQLRYEETRSEAMNIDEWAF